MLWLQYLSRGYMYSIKEQYTYIFLGAFFYDLPYISKYVTICLHENSRPSFQGIEIFIGTGAFFTFKAYRDPELFSKIRHLG